MKADARCSKFRDVEVWAQRYAVRKMFIDGVPLKKMSDIFDASETRLREINNLMTSSERRAKNRYRRLQRKYLDAVTALEKAESEFQEHCAIKGFAS